MSGLCLCSDVVVVGVVGGSVMWFSLVYVVVWLCNVYYYLFGFRALCYGEVLWLLCCIIH